MAKGQKVVGIKGVDKPPENPITHFTVSVFTKNDKLTVLENVIAIEITPTGLLVISRVDWAKVYPIINIEHYEFTRHRKGQCI